MDVRDLPMDELVLDADLNLRDRLDDFTVERYVEAGERMPPVAVFEVEGRWLLADGFHRHAAALRRGRRTIPAEVRAGTFADALDFAAGVNMLHGLPLGRAERRRAVEVRLRLHPDWSDRRLAEGLGVGRELVAKVRRQLVDAGQLPADGSRVGADGKAYTVGLPRDPNEHLPRGQAIAQQDDPRDRGGREADAPPWDDTADPLPSPTGNGPPRPDPEGPPWDAGDKKVALADPVSPAAPTIDEMLQMMARQIGEVVDWTRAEGFAQAYRAASVQTRALFQSAATELAARADQLRRN